MKYIHYIAMVEGTLSIFLSTCQLSCYQHSTPLQHISVHEDTTKCHYINTCLCPYFYPSSHVIRHVRVIVYIESESRGNPH